MIILVLDHKGEYLIPATRTGANNGSKEEPESWGNLWLDLCWVWGIIFLTFSQFYNLASLIIIIIWSASWKAFRIWNSTLCDEVSLLAVSILSLTAVCLMKLDTESFEQSFEQQPGFSVPLKFSICNTNPRKDRPQPVLAFAEYQ